MRSLQRCLAVLGLIGAFALSGMEGAAAQPAETPQTLYNKAQAAFDQGRLERCDLGLQPDPRAPGRNPAEPFESGHPQPDRPRPDQSR